MADARKIAFEISLVKKVGDADLDKSIEQPIFNKVFLVLVVSFWYFIAKGNRGFYILDRLLGN